MSRQEIIDRYFGKAINIIMLFLFSNILFSQTSVIAAGNQTETIGEVFPIIQQIQKESVSLNVPKFEVPIVVVKKKPLTWWQKLLKMFNFK